MYMCKQNAGNPKANEKDLEAIHRHPFDDHSKCSSSWCKHENTSTRKAKFTSLPYGKALTDTALQHSLKEVFRNYNSQVQKLSTLQSTQTNESFNATVSTKAPKRSHYSGSDSLDYRVSAATSQKNMGYTYLVDVSTTTYYN